MRARTVFPVLIVLLIAVGTFAQEDQENKPAAYIEEMAHDLGVIFERDAYKHSFKIENKGRADLVVESVRPG